MDHDTPMCAACGKEGKSDNMNTCNKCKEVKYCNAACKKKHRKKHKKACDRRVAELHDEQLFKEVEPEECPICFLLLPIDSIKSQFKSCCGKIICNGCIYAMLENEGGKVEGLCPYCRTPAPSTYEEAIERMNKLMDSNGEAGNMIACSFAIGNNGMPQNITKANELYLKAGELGCADAYYNFGISYQYGKGVEVDKKKAKQYLELAAMGGNKDARHNLGCLEFNDGNVQRAMKHRMIGARSGQKKALEAIKIGYSGGIVTKKEMEMLYGHITSGRRK